MPTEELVRKAVDAIASALTNAELVQFCTLDLDLHDLERQLTFRLLQRDESLVRGIFTDEYIATQIIGG